MNPEELKKTAESWAQENPNATLAEAFEIGALKMKAHMESEEGRTSGE